MLKINSSNSNDFSSSVFSNFYLRYRQASLYTVSLRDDFLYAIFTDVPFLYAYKLTDFMIVLIITLPSSAYNPLFSLNVNS